MSNIFFGKTSLDTTKSLLEKLKDNFAADKTAKHIFVVPDRISVNVEVKIFKALNIDSTCNIEVLTLSRLASRLTEDMPVVSKTTSCMILQKIIKENQSKLKCFNRHIDADLALNVFETISQFKSCKISPDEVFATTKNKILEDKLHDLSLLYLNYQTYLAQNNLYDSLDRLNFVGNKVGLDSTIRNSYFYICQFDSFTMQGFEILSEVLKYCKEFNIGIVMSDNPINEHVYDSEFVNKILNMFRSNGKTPNIVYARENVYGQFKVLQDNLFGANTIGGFKFDESKIELFELPTFADEVNVCCAIIKDLIINKGAKFTDFVVAVPNLSEKADILNNVFLNYDFSFYIDAAVKFKDSLLIRFIEDLFFIVQDNFSRQSVLSLIKNPLFACENEKIENFEDYLIRYNITEGYQLKSFNIEEKGYDDFVFVRDLVFSSTNEFFDNLKGAKKFEDFLQAFEGILIKLGVSQKLMNFAAEFTLQGNTKQAKLFEQYYDSLREIFENLRQVLGNEPCDLNLFYSTLFCGIASTKISTSPLSTNAIFIGDTSLSFFDRTKYLFVLGAQEASFPTTLNDCGIISDKEIEELSERYKLEPSIYSINKKERFKSFELLLKPSDKLYLSCNYEKSGSQKSRILQDISNMFVEENEQSKFYPLPFKNKDAIDFLVLNNNRLSAKNNLVDLLRDVFDGKDGNDFINLNELYWSVNKTGNSIDLNLFNFKNKIQITNNPFFTTSTVSVSQIENFMTCPFIHFVRYGLKLKEKDEGRLDSQNIGSILHEVAKFFVKRNLLPIEDNLIENKVIQIFDEVITQDKFLSISKNKYNKILIQNLKYEAIRFCGVLNYQAKYSRFKNLAVEARFDDKNLIKSFKIKVADKILSLVGQVDRIDTFGDYFRIIDYKTGKCDTSLKELFFGKKVQLQAYAKVVENSLKLKPAGAYYLPVKSGFGDEKVNFYSKYQLKGTTLDVESVIDASDTRFETSGALKSDIIEIRYTKNDLDAKVNSKLSKTLLQNQIEAICEYATNIISKACNDILMLNITPSPLVLSGDVCAECACKGLCRFDEGFGNMKRQPKTTISIDNFLQNKTSAINAKQTSTNSKTADLQSSEEEIICKEQTNLSKRNNDIGEGK